MESPMNSIRKPLSAVGQMLPSPASIFPIPKVLMALSESFITLTQRAFSSPSYTSRTTLSSSIILSMVLSPFTNTATLAIFPGSVTVESAKSSILRLFVLAANSIPLPENAHHLMPFLMMLLPMSFTFFSSLVISLPGPTRPASFTFLFTFLSI